MLRQAARSPCWRAPARFIAHHPAFPRSSASTRPPLATFQTTQLRTVSVNNRTDTKPPSEQKAPTPNPSTPPAATSQATPSPQKQSQNAATTQKNLLSESTVAHKEQRKADWAIMREMAKYLWPRVSFGKLVGRLRTLLTGYTTG